MQGFGRPRQIGLHNITVAFRAACAGFTMNGMAEEHIIRELGRRFPDKRFPFQNRLLKCFMAK
jgi:hypothetical protein